MADRKEDPFRNYGFFLELQGERAGYFMQVTGLGMKVETIEYREGGMPSTVYKLPGRTSIPSIDLTEGVTKSDALWKWLQTAVQGKVERRSVSIVVLAPDGQTEVTRWNLSGAWISGWKIKAFDALGNDVLLECLTLEAETLERATGAAA
jgi:phage tail-like protein